MNCELFESYVKLSRLDYERFLLNDFLNYLSSGKLSDYDLIINYVKNQIAAVETVFEKETLFENLMEVHYEFNNFIEDLKVKDLWLKR